LARSTRPRNSPRDGAEPETPSRGTRGYLYDAASQDREISVTRKAVSELHDRKILWIDLAEREVDRIRVVGDLLELDRRTITGLENPREALRLDNYGRYLQFAAIAAPTSASRAATGGTDDTPQERRIDFVVGRNWVLTVHSRELDYLQGFRDQDKGDTETGALSAPALSASLLDWHLEEYFAEVSRIEAAIDELDERILAAPSEEGLLEEILQIRRRSSRLRRTLMTQRSVFYGLSRPDLDQVVDADASAAFATLANRFERAVDEAEHTRDLSVGSFELFTSRSAQQTNDLVKALTFFTVIIGTTAAVAGLFGMNFDPPFFQTGSAGFFAVTLGLLVVGLGAWIVGRRRRWI
jgi:Mg2+ and Co2+ transporter CorA